MTCVAMVEQFRTYLLSKAAFTDDELQHMEAAAVAKKLKRREFLLRQGDVSRDMAFVVSGSLRHYRTDEHAQEHIMLFAIENWWLNDTESFRTRLPAKGAIEALENTHLLLFSKENFERLKKEIPAFSSLESLLAGRYLDAQANRLYTAISHGAEERYHEFVTAFPYFYPYT
jgi:CRP-like cAMP-binding protein